VKLRTQFDPDVDVIVAVNVCASNPLPLEKILTFVGLP
jgi:hypothetical protein